MSRVFAPNLTSDLLTAAALSEIQKSAPDLSTFRLLDLGSGGGHVGVQIATAMGLRELWSSDLDVRTESVVQQASVSSGIQIHHRIGSLFEPWEALQFDMIVDDVSGVATSIADVSPWFDGVPCDSGECGTLLVQRVLASAKDHLLKGGKLLFPIISLSSESKILDCARTHFSQVTLLKAKSWPLPKEMLDHVEILREAKSKGNASFEEKFGMIVCSTSTYLACDPK